MPGLPSWWKVVAFTLNLMCGLVLSQILGAFMDHDPYHVLVEVVGGFTMWALSFIMINVGYEFTIDKKDLAQYGWDYLIAMTAAGFPWLFVALWFFFTFQGLKADEAFLVARFSAPTSAGILFSMLEGAGLRETWVFQKARILAIFDDLDTILLMIPLKIIMIGFKWELTVTIGVMVIFLVLAWFFLHRLRLPYSWPWTLSYAAIVALFCKMLHYITHHYVKGMQPIHIEVLLPAFVIGCMLDTPCARAELKLQRQQSMQRKLTKEHTKQMLTKVEAWAAPEETFWQRSISKQSTNDGSDRPSKGSYDLRSAGQENDVQISAIPETPFPPGCVVEEPLPFKASARNISKSSATSAPRVAGSRKNSKSSTTSKTSEGSKGSKRRLSRHGLPLDEVREASEAVNQNQNLEETRVTTERAQEVCVSTEKAQEVCVKTEKAEEVGHEESALEHNVQTTVSMVFMVLVGLSMPPLFGHNAKDNGESMDAGLVVAHLLVVSILMVLGKMFPIVCYRDETSFRSRLALCLGMCPRGEVGASIIVISLELGVEGPAIIVAMFALVINLVSSGVFIGLVKVLLRGTEGSHDEPHEIARGNHDEPTPCSKVIDLQGTDGTKVEAHAVMEVDSF